MKQPKSIRSNHHMVRTSKIRPVPITEMRVAPVHVTQRPFKKAHGDAYAADLKLEHLGFPIINHRDGVYWVLDGQHRIYALKENGFGKELVDCEVYENLTDAEAADVFLGRDDRVAVNRFDKFHIACTAERPRETDIRRTVEAQGLKISKTKEENCVGAIGALERVYDRCGAVVLGQVCRTIRDAYGGDTAAFDGQVIEAFGHVFNRYNGRTNEKELAKRLSQAPHGVRGLLRRAEAQREKTGNTKSHCVASAVVDVYNKGLGPRDEKRLPSWWKDRA